MSRLWYVAGIDLISRPFAVRCSPLHYYHMHTAITCTDWGSFVYTMFCCIRYDMLLFVLRVYQKKFGTVRNRVAPSATQSSSLLPWSCVLIDHRSHHRKQVYCSFRVWFKPGTFMTTTRQFRENIVSARSHVSFPFMILLRCRCLCTNLTFLAKHLPERTEEAEGKTAPTQMKPIIPRIRFPQV